jgi:hypothetical protein
VKSNIGYVNSRSQRHAEGLNGAIEVLVIQRILIVPDSSSRSRHPVTDEENAIASRWPWSGLDWVAHRRTCPCLDGGLHSHCGPVFIEIEVGRPAYSVFTVGSVVILVAFSRMRLAPGILMRSDILCFGKIRRARIERGV